MGIAQALFTDAFDAELADEVETGHDPAEFRVGGRKRPTKANPYPTGEDEAFWRANGPRYVQHWIDWRQKSRWRVWTTPDGMPAIELGITTEVAGMPLKMVIDRVMVIPEHEALCIVDLKAGRRTPESDLQLAVYRLGLLQHYNIQVDFGAYWMAREGEMTAIVNLSRFSEPVIQTYFESLRLAIEHQIFIPHLTNMCRACGLNRYCLAYGGAEAHRDPDHPDYKEEQG